MELYNIYAGLGGGFGGASYKFTSKFSSDEEAADRAYEEAVQEYEMYEGSHGLDSLKDCIKEALESGRFSRYDNEDLLRYAEEIYTDRMEGWLDYFAIKSSEDINTERLKEDKEYEEY